MNDVMSIKQKLLDRMAELDYTNMNLMDLATCINMLRSIADMPEKSYMDTLAEVVGKMGGSKPAEGFGTGYAIGMGGE